MGFRERGHLHVPQAHLLVDIGHMKRGDIAISFRYFE